MLPRLVLHSMKGGFGSRVQGGNDIWLESHSGSLRFHSEFTVGN